VPGQGAFNGGGEPFDLGFAGDAGGLGAVAARGFHDEHVGLHIRETSAAQNGLVAEADVAGVEDGFLAPANQEAGGTERVAGVIKFQRGRGQAGPQLVVRGPGHFAVVGAGLKAGCQVVEFIVREERVFGDAEFIALAGHDIDRIVQHALDDVVTEVGHQHMRLGKMPQRDGQRPHVIVVTMGDRHGVHRLVGDLGIQRQTFVAPAFGVRARVHQEAVAGEFEQP
jgi:hypothetical protein